ncbi:MAG TPA: hypothetical protein VLT85_01205 [Terriglobales bacterium]|nr:hypothetical protein [Terriglobales bacterium]
MKRVKALVGLLLVVVGFYLAWELLPPYFANYQLQDALENEARLDSYNPNKTDADIKSSIVKAARDLDIRLKPEDVTISRDGPNLAISASYSVHVDLPGFPLDIKFNPATKNKRI